MSWYGGRQATKRAQPVRLHRAGHAGSRPGRRRVTHVDASKKAITWARQNQALSGLDERPIRWLVDDVEKFVKRELRRGSQYDGLVLDPPKFGRGPEGQVWEFFDALPGLLKDCRGLLSPQPLFVVVTAYAIPPSALSLFYPLGEMVAGLGGAWRPGSWRWSSTAPVACSRLPSSPAGRPINRHQPGPGLERSRWIRSLIPNSQYVHRRRDYSDQLVPRPFA